MTRVKCITIFEKKLLSTQSFNGCTRDVEEENGILGEVVGKVLELLAHSAHHLFEQTTVLHFKFLVHRRFPIGTFDGESHNTSHPAQGFFCCHRLAGLIATTNDGRMLSPALNAFLDSSHHWPLDDLVLRPAGLKRFHGLCQCCSDFALGRGFECPHCLCCRYNKTRSRNNDLPDLHVQSSAMGRAWAQILFHLEGKD